MTARDFYRLYVRDGRAVLRPDCMNPDTEWRARAGGYYRWHPPLAWLVELGSRLVLCYDRDPHPMIRFVEDEEMLVKTAPRCFQLLACEEPSLGDNEE